MEHGWGLSLLELPNYVLVCGGNKGCVTFWNLANFELHAFKTIAIEKEKQGKKKKKFS